MTAASGATGFRCLQPVQLPFGPFLGFWGEGGLEESRLPDRPISPSGDPSSLVMAFSCSWR